MPKHDIAGTPWVPIEQLTRDEGVVVLLSQDGSKEFGYQSALQNLLRVWNINSNTFQHRNVSQFDAYWPIVGNLTLPNNPPKMKDLQTRIAGIMKETMGGGIPEGEVMQAVNKIIDMVRNAPDEAEEEEDDWDE